MELPTELVSPACQLLGHALLWPVVGRALYLTVWRESRTPESVRRIWPPSCVAVLFVWQLEAGVYPGLSLHLLGAPLLTLMFCWRLALIGMSLVVAAISYQRGLGWASFGINAVIMGVVPVAVTKLVDTVAQRRLAPNLFTYVFLSAFAGAALAVATVGLFSSGLLIVTDAYSFEHLSRHYLGFYPLLIFPEAFLTGALIAIFVVYRPQWVATFDDERYLPRR